MSVNRRFSKRAVVAFPLTFTVCAAVLCFAIWNKSHNERLTAENLIAENSAKVTGVITKLIFKTQALAALVIHKDGHVEDFDKIANYIIDDPAVNNVLLAPDGVVADVFPLRGNEAVLGLNLLSEDGAGNKEAILARESGEMVLGGPFTLVQGGEALVGRLPVFLETAESESRFWGLVSVTLKYPQALEGAALDSLKSRGFAYELWRISPDTGDKQIIAHSEYDYNENSRYVEREIKIANATWYLRILPVRAWYEYAETWFLLALSLCASFFASYLLQSNYTLHCIKRQLEQTQREGSGICGRRSFIERAAAIAEQAKAEQSEAYIIVFKPDRPETADDGYDAKIARGISDMIRPRDLLSCGEDGEFILLITDVGEKTADDFVNNLRTRISELTAVREGGADVCASFGVAPLHGSYDITAALEAAQRSRFVYIGN